MKKSSLFPVKKILKAVFFLFLFQTILLFPTRASAGSYYACVIDPATNECIGDLHLVTYEGLVPCGRVLEVDGQYLDRHTIGTYIQLPPGYGVIQTFPDGSKEIAREIPCQFCHFFIMFREILDFVLKIVFVIAVLFVIVAGFLFILSQASKAKRILNTVIIGLALFFGTWLIVNTVFLFAGVADINLREGWFRINCPIPLVFPEQIKPRGDTQVIANDATGKTCSELCQERISSTWRCESIGLDPGGTDGYYVYRTTFKCDELLGNCSTRMENKSGFFGLLRCAGRRPNWTNCRCVK